MKIAITDNMGSEHKLQLYLDWLYRADPAMEIIKVSYILDNLAELSRCSGVIMTGGSDVDPLLYGGNAKHPKLGTVDRKRDDFERNVIDNALKNKLPLMGICRGLQIANVHLGGDLIPDLGEAGHQVHEAGEVKETRHRITVTGSGILSESAEIKCGEINSYHHQAALNPGKGLRVTGLSDDGIIEAMEFTEGACPSFFLLVQWHPERMNDDANPFCKNILHSFLLATKTKDNIHSLL
jgi:putative glutamine amidotransferase